jgi:hypothetical protein
LHSKQFMLCLTHELEQKLFFSSADEINRAIKILESKNMIDEEREL